MIDSNSKSDTLSNDLRLAWVITAAALFCLCGYVLIAHFLKADLQSQLALEETQRVVLRSVLYALAIATLPLTNLIRHIAIRLNQTMPGNTPAKKRYLVTVTVSMALVESVGLYGLIMFMLGDDFNTLYIFISMSALGMVLYRPKPMEYRAIVEALAAQNEE